MQHDPGAREDTAPNDIRAAECDATDEGERVGRQRVGVRAGVGGRRRERVDRGRPFVGGKDVLIPKRDVRPSGFFLHHDDASVEMGHHAALWTSWTGPRRDGAREVGLAAVRGPSARAVGLSKPELGPRDTGHIFVAADAPTAVTESRILEEPTLETKGTRKARRYFDVFTYGHSVTTSDKISSGIANVRVFLLKTWSRLAASRYRFWPLPRGGSRWRTLHARPDRGRHRVTARPPRSFSRDGQRRACSGTRGREASKICVRGRKKKDLRVEQPQPSAILSAHGDGERPLASRTERTWR